MKLGIFGANGFIGQSLNKYLSVTDCDIISFSRQRKIQSRVPWEQRIFSLENVSIESLRDISTLILCASATSPSTKNNDLKNEVTKNVEPHTRLLNIAKRTNIRHLIYLSSGGAVYGNQNINLISESSPIQPVTPYGIGKAMIENELKTIWNEPGRIFTIIRPSNPVGEFQLGTLGSHGLVTTAIVNMKRRLPIKIYGNGETVRDYFHVKDLCGLINLVINKKEIESDVINASSAVGRSINQIIDCIAEHLQLEPIINHERHLQPKIQRNILDNTRAKTNYCWLPETDLMSIIELLDRALSDAKN